MDLWLVAVLYMAGLALITAEAFLPGLVMGLIGLGMIGTSVFFGFRHHWAIGMAQIVLAVIVGPLALLTGMKRMTLKSTLEGGSSFASDYAALAGKQGESVTELRPAGVVAIDGRRIDVVTAGELVARGTAVKVVKVEGNRIVVRATDPESKI
ncbi:MAG TPA: NfeD family protein [Planctomycetota bacterium]